ncbi:MAG: hypothetical protein QM704_06460 [Anaeromyxobacteraceae bacterium]
MRRARFTSSPWAVLAAACAAACGAGPAAVPRVPDTPGACTGAAPANATPCPGADRGLTADAPRVLLPGACDGTPCAWTCGAGLEPRAGLCVAPAERPPAPTVSDNGDGTITVEDAIARLVWLKDGRCRTPLAGAVPDTDGLAWTDAMRWAAALGDGACGLTDGSAPGDWKLPEPHELGHLQGPSTSGAFLHAEGGVWWTDYWLDDWCGAMPLPSGAMFMNDRAWRFGAWPVRRW